MKIKLLTFYKGPQFAKNPLKSYMRQQEAFRADIFFKYDLENDLFSSNQAALWMVFSVRLSVRPSHLFDYVPIIVSSWNFQELSPRTRVRSMQKVKVRGQGHRGHDPT